MIRELFDLFQFRPIAAEFARESRLMVLGRLRLGVALAIILILLFVPLDYLRLGSSFAAVLWIRLAGAFVLLAVLPFTTRVTSEPRAHALAAAVIATVSVTILAVARLSTGAADPVYLTQATAIVFVIMGTGLLFPLDGRMMLFLGTIPVALQTVMTIDFAFLENLPILVSSLMALALATVGARAAFLSRLGDYEGKLAKEALLRARSDIVDILRNEVDERKTNEEKLRKSERKYRNLFEESMDGVVLATPDGRLLDANAAAIEIFGYASRDEFLAVSSHELYFDSSGRERFTERVRKSGPLKDVEVELKHKDGRKLHVVLSASPAREESGGLLGYRTILRDVTQTKLLEARLRQTQKLEAVGMLAAGVAHEINNPLTYVLTHLETIRDDLAALRGATPGPGLLDSLRSRILEAAEGAERVRRIVRDLKTFARVEEEECTAIDVASVVERAIKMAAPEIRYRARLRIEIAPMPPVFANEGRLGQVFLNLLINAAQAIPEGEIERNEVAVRSRITAGEVIVEVVDTGKGIRPEDLERIFDPFFTTKPQTEGSGLGLSICYNIVKAYGGHIDVDSTPSRGSRFTVRLPVAEVTGEHAFVEQPVHTPKRHGRVLIVDDEPFVVSTARMILARVHEVVGAANGAEALAVLENDQRFDVILCDLMMDGATGMDLYTCLLHRCPELSPRMVFMTGGAFTAEARRFLANVSNPRIEKPFGSAELLKIVDRVVGESPGDPPSEELRPPVAQRSVSGA